MKADTENLLKCVQPNGANTYASAEPKKMKEDTNKHTGLVPKAKVLAQSS